MAPSIVSEVRPHAVEVAVTHATVTGDFVELVLADDELARGEFEAMVAAGWGGHAPGGRRRGEVRGGPGSRWRTSGLAPVVVRGSR